MEGMTANPIHAVAAAEPTAKVAAAVSTKTAAAATTTAGLGLAGKITVGVTMAAVLSAVIGVSVAYTALKPPSVPAWADRVYHLTAEEVLHDYAAGSSVDNCTSSPTAVVDSDAAATFLLNDPAAGFIGSTYWRRRFMRYEPDGTFSRPVTTETAADPAWEHLGALGPILRAHAGDMLRVRLRNKSRFPVSFHVHGLHYYSVAVVEDVPSSSAGQSQGSPGTIISAVLNLVGAPADGGAGNNNKVVVDPFSGGARRYTLLCADTRGCEQLASTQGTNVPPGGTIEYAILVPDEAGPGEGEPSSVARLYQSLPYAGHDVSLSGMLVVTPRPGNKDPTKAAAPARPGDIQSEAALLFSVANENDSPYLGLNVLDFVMRGRVGAANPTLAREVTAAQRGSSVFPLNADVSAGAVIASLYNSAVKMMLATNTSMLPAGGLQEEELDEEHAAVLSITGGVGTTVTTTLSVTTLLGVHLGLQLYPASAHASSMVLVDATAFVAVYGRATAELAFGDLALACLEGESSYDAGAFEESNLMHSVNGRLYCNMRGLEFTQGDKVRWHTAVVGTEVDLHAVHWHGNTLLHRGRRTDSIPLLPRQIVSVDMDAHSPGRWMLHCHVTDHIHAGMVTLYTVKGSAATSVNLIGPSGSGTVAVNVPSALAPQLTGRVREYFVQAEVQNWTYMDMPEGHHAGDEMPACGDADMEALQHDVGDTPFPKALYVQYTDASFTTPVARPAEWAHLGMLGPVIRAEVGDVIKITFRNKTPRPFSMHPHGVAYAKAGEGAPYNDGTSGSDTNDDAVEPNSQWTFSWFVPDTAGPGPADPASLPWLYHGHVMETEDENAGMIGVVLITGRGKARTPGGSPSLSSTDLVPSGVDKEIVVLTKVFEEGPYVPPTHNHRRLGSSGDSSNSKAVAPHARRLEVEDHPDLFSLNGKVGCSLPGLEVPTGASVRLYFVSLGNEIDLHYMSVTGHTMVFGGHRQAGVSLMPGTMFAADMTAGTPGEWLLTSTVRSHAKQGMVARFTVTGSSNNNHGGHADHGGAPQPAPSPTPAPGGSVRSYFIAAEESAEWDYTPSGKDMCVPDEVKTTLEADAFPALPEDERYDVANTDLNGYPEGGRIFVGRGLVNGTTLGRVYKKALYVAYADASFGSVLYRPGSTAPAMTNLRSSATSVASASRGLLGPTIRAAVGDVLVVTFQNSLSFPANLNFAHGPVLVGMRTGVAGSSVSTWTVPANVTTPAEMADWPVPPGWAAQYTWTVPAEAGPAAKDPSTLAWPYLSSVDSNHLYAGLVGPAIIAASPAALAPGFPAHGADREYVLAWFIHNENSSPFLEDNMAAYVDNPEGADVDNEEFQESNLMHAVNGRLFCNMEGLTATVGQSVRLHMMGLGAELDMHTPQVHGTLLTISKGRDGAGKTQADAHAAAVALHPGASAAVDFPAEAPGSWLVECGVNDHFGAGMRALLQVSA